MPASMTITGVDERTSADDISRLIEQYPWLEIGMLYTVTPEGRNRYPSFDWLVEAAGVLSGRCALHVCGRGARGELLVGNLAGVMRHVARLQVNGVFDIDTLGTICSSVGSDTTVITQDHPDNRDLRLQRGSRNHALLVDGSGGRGIGPSTWVRPSTWKHVGFAGGLGPDNLATELPKIAAVARGEFWVDMENNLRTDDWFDIEKAKRACEAFAEWREKA